MFLPYEMTVSLWFSANPLYRWEPLQPARENDAVEPCDDTPATLPAGAEIENENEADVAAQAKPAGLPAMRLVFKGLKWTAYPVYTIRENLAWNEASALLQQVDEHNRDDGAREGRKPVPRAPLPKPQA